MHYYTRRFFREKKESIYGGFILLGLNLLFSDSMIMKLLTVFVFSIINMYIYYMAAMEFYNFYIGSQSVLESLLPISKKEAGKGMILGHFLLLLLMTLLQFVSLVSPLIVNYLRIPAPLMEEYGLSTISTLLLENMNLGVMITLGTFTEVIYSLLLVYNVVEVVMGRWKKKIGSAVGVYIFINFLINSFVIIVDKFLYKGMPLTDEWAQLLNNYQTKPFAMIVSLILIAVLGLRLYKMIGKFNATEDEMR